jgi:hypothetical protein
MDSEQPIEAQPDEVASPDTGVGTSDDSFTTANDLPPELETRYKSMQADYTRKTQELAEQRREAEAALEFVEALQDESTRENALRQIAEFVGEDFYLTAAGFEADGEDTEDGEFSDEDFAVNDPRVDQLAAEWESYKRGQQEKEILHEIESFTDGEMARLGIEDETEQQAVLSIAATLDLDSRGLPQIEAARGMLEELFNERQKSWIGSKKAPRQPLQGSPADEKFDFSDEDERRRRMAALIEAND